MHATRLHIILFALFCLFLSACNEPTVIIDEPLQHSSPSFSSHSSFSSRPLQSANIHIAMPFASQAPNGDWGDPYQEACEEASLLLVHHYLSKEPLDNGIMDKDILDLVQWETDHGYSHDVTIAQLSDIAEAKFGYTTEVIEGSDVTIDRIEEELAKGNPVIVPLQGQDIGNPYFSGDGPPYHMLVIIGYNGSAGSPQAGYFITHDVGTRHGANYAYKKDVIMNAIHDWTGSKETMRSGPKAMLVVTK